MHSTPKQIEHMIGGGVRNVTWNANTTHDFPRVWSLKNDPGQWHFLSWHDRRCVLAELHCMTERDVEAANVPAWLMDHYRTWPETFLPIGIVGSREYPQERYGLISGIVQMINLRCYKTPVCPIFISGGARGVDSVAIKSAKRYNLPTVVFHPNPIHGTMKQYHIRNYEIARASTALIAFVADSNHPSRGTASTWSYFKQKGPTYQAFMFGPYDYGCIQQIETSLKGLPEKVKSVKPFETIQADVDALF